ncbi:MAG: 4Fe-4S dicluster domain-containing protein [Syntrophobacterales bacterium]|nr:4Fe-4S dicluster domain-containing protein [Syntrophobacterales bacterium]
MERLRVLALNSTYDESFIRQVEMESGQQISRCYQCGNCGASCNYTCVYDYPVNQIMRLIQLGQKEVVLSSRAIWLCAACTACTTRCPCNIEVTKIMETLRVMSLEEGTVSLKDVELFYKEFLRSLKNFGRVFEAGLLPLVNLRIGRPFNDMELAPLVFKGRKIHLFPSFIKGRKEISAIFDRFESWRRKKEDLS